MSRRRYSEMLRHMTPAIEREVAQRMYVAGDLIAKEAQISISRGSVSGKKHVPSAPGQPPNQDTGTLANHIEVLQVKPLRVEISSNAPYSAALEFGTSKMAERPFMRPAVAAKKGEAISVIQAAARRGARKGKFGL